MVRGVVADVERSVVSPLRGHSVNALDVRALGPLRISREAVAVALPGSRKVRALIAYLALAPRAVTRTHLCELLGDIADDPRGELRWCLSKLRLVVDMPELRRLHTVADTVQLDLSGCSVDAVDIEQAMQAGTSTQEYSRLRELAQACAGDFLEGLDLDRSPHFNSWLASQRRRFRAWQVAILEELATRSDTPPAEAFADLEAWLRLAPLDACAHQVLLKSLFARGQVREGEAHLAATARVFEAEGLDWRPLRELWRDLRAGPSLPAASATQTDDRSEPPQKVAAEPEALAHRASIAIMPFIDAVGNAPAPGGLADGLVHDIITRLSKLRSLFVIAQGTVFALGERRVGAADAGRTLNVDYFVSGSLRRREDRVMVSVELTQTRTARVLWADTLEHRLGDVFELLDDVGTRIVASVDAEIEAAERNRAVLKPPTSLDAWEAHHRGLWHMYRFDETNNQRARGFFEKAVALDPTFSRAYAGLSFTYFQSTFQHWRESGNATEAAYAAASRSLVADERDPAAHWAMGRALWLRGQQEPALSELQAAVQLSPNFALGHYTLAFVHSQSGDPNEAIAHADLSRSLSPFDPLLFGMLGARAMALARLGRFEEAAGWASRAAARPNAHAHIEAIAAHCLALAGRVDEARAIMGSIHKRVPRYRGSDFLGAFRFDADAHALFRSASVAIGIS